MNRKILHQAYCIFLNYFFAKRNSSEFMVIFNNEPTRDFGLKHEKFIKNYGSSSFAELFKIITNIVMILNNCNDLE